jgi:hypothetical protein
MRRPAKVERGSGRGLGYWRPAAPRQVRSEGTFRPLPVQLDAAMPHYNPLPKGGEAHAFAMVQSTICAEAEATEEGRGCGSWLSKTIAISIAS